MWKKLGIAIFGGLAALLIGSALVLPSEVTVSRALDISADREVVFSNISDLKNWNSWSPWYAKDKQMKMTYSKEPASGVGAQAEWQSESQGSGSMTIIEQESPATVVLALDFGLRGKAQTRFDLEATGESGTRVTWSMTSHLGNIPVRKLFGSTLERQVGADFEDGLKRLKEWTEFQRAVKENPDETQGGVRAPGIGLP